MSRIPWQERVVIDRDLHHGDPCIKKLSAGYSLHGLIVEGAKPCAQGTAQDDETR